MGIVSRQSMIGTTLAYIGVVIGYFNSLYIRPEFLSLSEIGIFNLVTANAMLLSPLCTAGMTGTVIKFFPEFRSKGSTNQFFTFLILIILVVNGVVLAVGFAFQNAIISFLNENAGGYIPYLIVTAVIIVCNSLFDLLYAFCKSFMSIVMPSFLRDIFLRAGSILLVGGYGLGYWTFEIAAQGLGLTYMVSLVLLLFYVLIKYNIRFSFAPVEGELKRRIISFGGYSMLLAGSYAFIHNISYLQVSSIIGEEANGIFTTCFIIGVIVDMPRRNMLKVLAPMFSKAMQEKDLTKVTALYKKGSITMSVLGGLLFIGIITNLNDLFAFIPQGEKFAVGFWLVVCICLTKFLIMIFSFAQEIIVFSMHNRLALYFQLGTAAVLFISNIVLLPIFGVVGAGMSYMIAIGLHSFIKYLLVYKRFNLSPFSIKHLELFVIFLVGFGIFWYLPIPLHPALSITVRAILTTLFYLGLVYQRKISEDVNELIGSYVKRLFGKA